GKMPAPQRAFPYAGLLAGGEGEEFFVGADLRVRPNRRVDAMPSSAAGTHLSDELEKYFLIY
ncbi:MAG TPA: hypothetical protein PK360_14745, partial [bacterium]|nr:hypothetical protein [bacterium]